MTNPAPAPQPDLHERIAEIFPCICIPPFEDGAHWHDCPTGFRKEVEELVAEETAALRAQLFDSQDYIAVVNRKIEAVYGQQTSVGKVLEDLAEARRERDEAREKLAEVQKLAGSLRDGPFMQMASQIEAALGAESPRKDAPDA